MGFIGRNRRNLSPNCCVCLNALMACVGIDLGGTAIKAGLLGPGGRILARTELPTPQTGPAAVVSRIVEAVAAVRGRRRLSVLGVGSAGPINDDRTMILEAPNLPGFVRVPLVRLLHARTGLRIRMENDANCAGLAEFRYGAGRGARSMVLLTLGTGIGGAVIFDGRILGPGELGHVSIDARGRRCGCGGRGCVERYASATAIVRAYGGRATAREIFNAARRGRRRAVQVVEEACGYLGTALAGIVHTLEPERIVLSGGMASAGGTLLKRVRAHTRARVFRSFRRRVKIVRGRLGPDAGWIGAAMLVGR